MHCTVQTSNTVVIQPYTFESDTDVSEEETETLAHGRPHVDAPERLSLVPPALSPAPLPKAHTPIVHISLLVFNFS